MSSTRRSSDFSFFDLPRALWYFLGPERWTFLLFSGLLLAVFSYVIVPPYIVGLITNFLIDYASAGSGARPSLAPLYWLVTILAASYALVGAGPAFQQTHDGPDQFECPLPSEGVGF